MKSSVVSLAVRSALSLFFLSALAILMGQDATADSIRAPSDANCPLVEFGETPADCPWAAIGRSLHEAVTKRVPLASQFPKLDHTYFQDEFLKRFRQEGGSTPYKALWGKSINVDAGMHQKVLDDELIDYLLAGFHVAPRQTKNGLVNIVHAGVEHTYGYLFSILRTTYGYKRARWTGDDLERGFDLPTGILRPLPNSGEFFSNVSAFAGRIAFRAVEGSEDPEADRRALAVIRSGRNVAKAISHYPFANLKVTRLQETLRIPAKTGERKIVIRTDLVPFIGTKGSNTTLLVYSIRDTNTRNPFLISLFPVSDDMVKSVTDPKLLGEDQPIVTRYNAYVPGITVIPEVISTPDSPVTPVTLPTLSSLPSFRGSRKLLTETLWSPSHEK